jgi:hypothetical protein
LQVDADLRRDLANSSTEEIQRWLRGNATQDFMRTRAAVLESPTVSKLNLMEMVEALLRQQGMSLGDRSLWMTGGSPPRPASTVESELHRSAREIFAPLLKNNDGAVDPVIFADLVCDTCREIDHPDPTRAAADLREALIRLLGQIAPENWRLQQLADAFTRNWIQKFHRAS